MVKAERKGFNLLDNSERRNHLPHEAVIKLAIIKDKGIEAQEILSREIDTLRISQEEKERLQNEVIAGNKAINSLIETNLGLVADIGRKYASRRMLGTQFDLDDLIQEGCIGLRTAVIKYDWSKGFRLSTYAHAWILQAMGRAVINNGSMIRLPVHLTNRTIRINRLISSAQAGGFELTTSEIASETNLDEAQVKEILGLQTEVYSLDIPIDNEQEVVFGDLVRDKRVDIPTQVDDSMTTEALLSDMSVLLDPVDFQVLKLRLGLGSDHREYIFSEIAQILGVSAQATFGYEKIALKRLKAFLSRNPDNWGRLGNNDSTSPYHRKSQKREEMTRELIPTR